MQTAEEEATSQSAPCIPDFEELSSTIERPRMWWEDLLYDEGNRMVTEW
jgi:hypothetical protein